MKVLLVDPDLTLGSGHVLMLDWVTLPQKDQVCSLRVLLDPALQLDKLIAAVAKNAFYQLS